MMNPLQNCFRILLATLALAAGNAYATFHLWQVTQVYSNADGTVQYVELMAMSGGQQFLSGHTITARQGTNTHTYMFNQGLPGNTATTTGGGYGGTYTSYRTLLIGTQGFAALHVVTPDYVVPNGFLFTTNGSVDWGGGFDVFSYASLPTDGRLALNRDGTNPVNSPQNFDGTMGTVVLQSTGSGGGAMTKSVGSRATASPTVTIFGGFEIANASTVYILVRGNSLGTLGVTQSFLDSPRVRLFDSQGHDLITDGQGVAGFTGCTSSVNAGGPVLTYYTSVRAQAPHARDGCTSQSLAAGVYTFAVSPSTTGAISSPATGEILFEVTLNP